MAYFSAFQGEGDHLRGTLEGDMYLFRAVRRMAGTLQVGMKRGYSRRMMPLTSAMAWRYDFSSSNGGYLVLSETMQI